MKDIREHFSKLEDPRIDRNKRHNLLDIVLLVICGVTSGAEGWEAIRLVPVDNSLIFINFMNRLRAKRTDSLTNRFFLLSIRPI